MNATCVTVTEHLASQYKQALSDKWNAVSTHHISYSGLYNPIVTLRNMPDLPD